MCTCGHGRLQYLFISLSISPTLLCLAWVGTESAEMQTASTAVHQSKNIFFFWGFPVEFSEDAYYGAGIYINGRPIGRPVPQPHARLSHACMADSSRSA